MKKIDTFGNGGRRSVSTPSKTERVDLSIIIVSYNTKQLLVDCLQSLYKSLHGSSVSAEVIVIDNHSTDGSSAAVKKEFPDVVLLQNEENVGFGKANNQGAEKAKGETLLFLNSDILVQGKAIGKLYVYFKTLPTNSIVGGKLFNTDGSPQSSAGPHYSLVHIFTALFLKGDHLHLTRYSPNHIKEVDWVMGACFMLSKSLFQSVGRFDESIFMYMEEIDFEYRAKKRGARIYFYPDAHFTHVGAGSSKGRATPILNVFKGFLYFYRKHCSTLENVLLRAMLILKSSMAIVLFSALGKKDDRDVYIKSLKLVI